MDILLPSSSSIRNVLDFLLLGRVRLTHRARTLSRKIDRDTTSALSLSQHRSRRYTTATRPKKDASVHRIKSEKERSTCTATAQRPTHSSDLETDQTRPLRTPHACSWRQCRRWPSAALAPPLRISTAVTKCTCHLSTECSTGSSLSPVSCSSTTRSATPRGTARWPRSCSRYVTVLALSLDLCLSESSLPSTHHLDGCLRGCMLA